jgi:hypothetical protein
MNIPDNSQISVFKEYFELHLNTKMDSIEIEELLVYLQNTNELIKSINQTLNSNYSAGFDDISISICTIKEGSIRIPLWITKTLNNPYIITLSTNVIGGLVVALLSNTGNSHTIETGAGNYEVTNQELLQNKTTKKTVSSIAQAVVENDSIRDLSITYEKEEGKREEINITKRTLSDVIEKCDTEDDENVILNTNVRLKIVSPVLENKPGSWRVELNGQKFYARMSDADFLETMSVQKIAFAEGDEIIADVEFVISENENGQHIKRYIRKVHSYPKFRRITKQGQSQLTLDL